MRNRSFGVRKPSQRRTSRLVSGTRLLAPSQSSTACNPSRCDIVHAQRVQLQHPEVTAVFDIDQNAAGATRLQLLPRLAREHVLIAGPHMPFPALGTLRKEGSGYSWVPVVFTDQWVDK